MAYCGFSDSSSDDDENQDDDLNQDTLTTTTHQNGSTQSQDTSNKDSKAQENGDDDDWINSKPKLIAEPKQNNNTKKRPRRKSVTHTFNTYLADTSLKDIKDQIGGNKPNKQISAAPPPPLQDLTDNTTMTFNHSKGTYKKKRRHRKTLDIPEYIPPSKHPWSIPPSITGVSAQVSVGKKLDKEPFFQPAKLKLSRIIHLLNNVEYRPEEFVAIRMRLKNPEITVTIFSNGKLTTQGGRSQYSCTIALRKVARMLQQLEDYKNEIDEITEPQFYGIQCNAHLGQRVDLQAMSEAFPKKVEYSPDIESAYLKFRDPLKYGDKGSCHVYHGGRVTILGCHSVKKCIIWIEQMYKHCKPHFLTEEAMNVEDNVSNQDFTKMFGSSDVQMNQVHSNHNNNSNHVDNDDNDAFGIAPPPTLFDIAPPPLL